MKNITTIAQRYWKPLIVLNSIIIVGAIASAKFSPRSWTANTQLILPDTTSNLDASLGTLGNLKDTSINFSNEVNPLRTQASIITSQDVLEKVWQADPEQSKFDRLATYSKLFKATPIDQSTTISVEVQGASPQLAHQRTAMLIKAYQQRVNELRKDEAVAREQFSENELEKASQRLSQAQRNLAAFTKSSGLVNGEEQTKGLVLTISNLTDAHAQALAEAQSNQTLSENLSAQIRLTPDQAIRSLGLGENKSYQFARQELSKVEADLLIARSRFSDNHPGVQTLLAQRNQLTSQIKQYVGQAASNTAGVDTNVGSDGTDGRVTLIQRLVIAEGESKAKQRQAAQLQEQLNQLNQEMRAIPANQLQVNELQRQYDIAEGVYKGLIAQVQQAKISAFNSYPNVQILDTATVDPKPTTPKKSLIALGGLLSAIFGSLSLLLFLESRNPLLKPKDLQEMEFPVLARIPRCKQAAMNLDLGVETEVEFQRLASAISLMHLENHRLMVSSSTFGEGKTTITLGLAMALIDLGFRVLVVDGDFRRANLTQRLGYSQLTTSEPELMPVEIRPRLDLIPTSPRNDRKIIEYVARGDFERRIDAIQASGDYDYIIVDSAPVGLTSEAALMAAAVSNVLLVVRLGISDRDMVHQTLDQLTRHNAQIIGLALNGVETRTEGYLYKREPQTNR